MPHGCIQRGSGAGHPKHVGGIAKAIGIGAEANNPGMVVSLGGFYIRSHKVVLWNWLERATL